jgi:hypothetical protein
MATELWRRAERFHQVGIVVDDLERAMGSMSAALGCPEDSWTVFADAEPFEHVEDGVAMSARTRYARAASGATVYQLLEPVEGDTVWQRWLDAGVTTFAVGYYVRDLAAAEDGLLASGGKRLAWGRVREGDQLFAYSFVQLADSGLVIELMSAAEA